MPTPSQLDSATGYQNGFVNSLSTSYTVPGGGANKTFVCFVLDRNPGTVTAISLNGVALIDRGGNGGTTSYIRAFTLNAPATGTLSCSLSGFVRVGMIFFTLQDVDQTTVIRTGLGTESLGASSLATGSFTTVVGDLVIGAAMAYQEDHTAFTPPAGSTNVLNTFTIDPGSGFSLGTNAASIVASGTSTSLTWSTGVPSTKGVFALPFVGASGGGGAVISDHNFSKTRGIGSGIARGARYAPDRRISLEAYYRERERAMRDFMRQVERAA